MNLKVPSSNSKACQDLYFIDVKLSPVFIDTSHL